MSTLDALDAIRARLEEGLRSFLVGIHPETRDRLRRITADHVARVLELNAADIYPHLAVTIDDEGIATVTPDPDYFTREQLVRLALAQRGA